MKKNFLRAAAILLLLVQLFAAAGCAKKTETTAKVSETVTLTPTLISSEETESKVEEQGPLATVFATSDFQNSNGDSVALASLNGLAISAIAAGHEDVDLTIITGDYGVGITTPKKKIDKIKEAFGHRGWGEADNIFLQGNHDTAHPGTEGLYGFEPYEHEYFSVFPIHEDMFMHYGSDPYTVKETAKTLTAYLEKKLDEGYDRPVFVISHLPLHYTMRVKEGDAKDAILLFEPLNRAAEQGLNIIFLFGHNHSHGWDSYLGNGSIYLTKGDSMYVNDPDRPNKLRSYELNFTYMNSGYCGYITGGGEDNKSDYSLTASTFDIYEDRVVINRYDQKGLHDLKAAGDLNTEKNDHSMRIEANTKVYTSPQILTLSKEQKPLPTVKITGEDIVKTGGTLTLKATAEHFTETPEFAWKATSSCLEVTAEGDTLKVKGKTEGTADIRLTVTAGDEKVTAWCTVSVAKSAANCYKRVMSMDDLKDGGKYILIAEGEIVSTKYGEKPDDTGAYFGGLIFVDGGDSISKPYLEGKYDQHEFTFEKTEGGWLLKAKGGYLTVKKFESSTGNKSSGYAATITAEGSVFNFNGAGKPFITTTLDDKRMTLYHKSLGLLTAKDDNGNYMFYIYEAM